MDIWDYRVINRNGSYGIYEVHYNSDGFPEFAGSEPVSIQTDSIESLTAMCIHVSSALTKPVLDFKIFEHEKNIHQSTNSALDMLKAKK
jgi:hypothetical protein